MPKPDGTLTLQERAEERNKIGYAQVAAKQERQRLNSILSHPAVKSGRLYKLGIFLACSTDIPADEARRTLDAGHEGDETKVHREVATGYEAGRAAAQQLTDYESERRRIQAQNDAGFEAELERRGGRPKDNRTDREKQRDEDFANIARKSGRKDDENSQDNDQLRSMGFGSGAQFERSAYEQGAAAASRILGKPATTAARPAYAPPMREAPSRATSAPSADATYSAGAAAARHLLGDTSAVRAEADAELRAKFAEQQAARAQE